MKKHLTKCLAVAMTASILSTSCASIIHGSSQELKLDSSPSQASITIKNSAGTVVYQGTTPANVTLKGGAKFFKREEYQVTYHKEGYQDKIVTLTPRVDGWYWGNLLLGGAIGMLIVDPATGAMYTFKDEQRVEVLEANSVGGLEVKDISEIPAEQRASLVKIY